MSLLLFTFGDSILDCARYNAHRIAPAQLLVRNHDALFPHHAGKDLASHGVETTLVHRARDGATSRGLAAQLQGLELESAERSERAVALVTVGGNDLLSGAIADPSGAGVEATAVRVEAFLQALPIRPVLLGNVYDPTAGDDSNNFLPVDPQLGRRNHQRLNKLLADMAPRFGALVDLHSHFLQGPPSWFTGVIEPSLEGASEVRRAFLPHVLQAAGVAPASVAAGGGGGKSRAQEQGSASSCTVS